MAKLDVCLETVFTNLPYEKRIAKIAKLGYDTVEFWHPEGTFNGKIINEKMPKDPVVLRQVCKENKVKVAGFALNAWNGQYGGCPTRAADRKKFVEQIAKMIEFAGQIDCQSGIILTGLVQKGLTRAQMQKNVEKAFGDALEIAKKKKFTLLVEPLNTYVDHGGFYLDSAAEGIELVKSFKSPYMKLLYDIYLMQIMGGNVIATLTKNVDVVGHVHVAGVPGRAEPHLCELNYPYIFQAMDQAGYKGRFGLEYFPKMEFAKSLKLQLKMVK